MARILVIAYSTYICDARIKRHAEALAARGDTVDLICLAAEQTTALHGVNVIPVALTRYRGARRKRYAQAYLRFFLKASVLATRLARKRRYDVVVVCTMPDAAIVCALIPKFLGSKVILDMHDTMPELYQDKFGGRKGSVGAMLLMLQERASALLANRVVAVHGLHAERLVKAGIPRSKIITVLNSPDPRLFRPAAVRSDSDHFTLVCHGTISRRLGLETAIEAIAVLKDRLPTLRLRIIGIGDDKDRLRALSARLGLQSQVVFVHRIPVEELPSALAEASAGLVPNLASSATHLMLPAKMLEYAACGIPIIAARLRTIEHYFPPDSVCFFTSGNASSLASAIELLYFDRRRCSALATRASEVAGQFAWTSQRAQLFNAIDSLLR